VSPEVLIPSLLVGVPVGIFLLVKVLLWKIRKARWREAATIMNAEYSGEGLLRCGKIQGKRKGRPFKIEIRQTGGGRTGKFAATWITAPLLNKGLVLYLPSTFFDRGCDPAKALKKRRYMQDVRVFVTHIQVERVESESLLPEEQTQFAAALKGWDPTFSAVGNPVGRESVTVQPQEVVFSENRVITDVRRLEALADLVTELANRIEKNPIENYGMPP
jgi:hypothetical protein